MPAWQRGDARHAKSIRGVPWQPNPAEAAEGEPVSMARTVGVPMVGSENRPVVPVWIQESTERVDLTSDEKWSSSSSTVQKTAMDAMQRSWGAEAKAHSEGCRVRIRQAMMNDDMGQQRLQEALQRRARTGGQVSDAPRVEVVLWS